MISSLYAKIGAAGVALIFVGVVCLYLIIKNAVYLWLIEKDFRKVISKISKEENPQARNSVIEENVRNPLIGVLNDILKTHAQHSDDIKSETAFLLNHYLRKPIRDITLIKVAAVISPLLGLLGTLLGLLGVFGKLSTTSSAAAGTILAAGIWEAIYTTVMGLSLAIPSLVAYHLLTIYIRSFNLETIEYGYRFLGNSHYCLSGKKHKARR
jgi:biopolymer transport protein ExbB